jgi:hypothetical protein
LKNIFFLSLLTHTCEVVSVGGASTGATLGKLQYHLWSGSPFSRLGNWESLQMRQKRAKTLISNIPYSCCETSH